MDDPILLAVASGLSALLGSLITGWITYKTAIDQRAAIRNKSRLARTLRDIAAFHRLEELYANALAATDSRSAAAWKRDIRKRLRNGGFDSPSETATKLHAERGIKELDYEQSPCR